MKRRLSSALTLFALLAGTVLLAGSRLDNSLRDTSCPGQRHDSSTLLTGAEAFIADTSSANGIASLRGRRVAVVANQTSVVHNDTAGLTHLIDTLLASGTDIVKIFCPEHGFRGTAAAGAHVANSNDPATGLPIVSLYGNNKKPSPQQLADVDIVLFDLQDVGCRFYTYLSTLHYVMEACGENGKPLILLDRPNPNGHYIDGPVLDTATCRSFVGLHPVPVVYAMTIGEYALMVNGEGWTHHHCDLTVVPLIGYRRDNANYQLPVPPSPNLRNAHAIALYPSLCLFEGTTVSVGRGTDTPFEVIGTPHPASQSRAKSFSINGNKVPSIAFTPKGAKPCFGLNLRGVTPPDKFDLSYLSFMLQLSKPDSFFLKNNFFDKLAGNTALRRQLQQGLPEEDIRASWQPALDNFKQIRKHYLLYPDLQNN